MEFTCRVRRRVEGEGHAEVEIALGVADNVIFKYDVRLVFYWWESDTAIVEGQVSSVKLLLVHNFKVKVWDLLYETACTERKTPI